MEVTKQRLIDVFTKYCNDAKNDLVRQLNYKYQQNQDVCQVIDSDMMVQIYKEPQGEEGFVQNYCLKAWFNLRAYEVPEPVTYELAGDEYCKLKAMYANPNRNTEPRKMII